MPDEAVVGEQLTDLGLALMHAQFLEVGIGVLMRLCLDIGLEFASARALETTSDEGAIEVQSRSTIPSTASSAAAGILQLTV